MRRGLLLIALVAGCSRDDEVLGAWPTDSSIDARADTTMSIDASDAADSTVTETSSDAAEDTVDAAATDAAPDVADTSTDAPCSTVGIEVTITADLFANCMPIVPMDPVHVDGSITVKNGSACTIGKVVVNSGFLMSGPTAWASFNVDPVDLGTLAPGDSKTSAFTKTPDTLSTSVDPCESGTGTAKCGTDVTVALSIHGLGMAGAKIVEAPATSSYSCVF